MTIFTHSPADAADDTPANCVDPKWNHPVTSGDIHKLAREIEVRLGMIERIQRVQSAQLGLILLGVIALIVRRFM